MDVEDLISRLCATAGMIMEDASVDAVSVGGSVRQRAAAVLRSSDEISAWAKAAVVLADRLHESR